VKCGCFTLGLLAVLAALLLSWCHHPTAPRGATSNGAKPAPVVTEAVKPVAPQVEQLSTCITAIAAQSDPAKLATLGRRAANPRLKRIMYWLAAARDTGADPGAVIDQAQTANHSAGTPRAPLVKVSLLRNLKICDGLAMLDAEDRAKLRRGNAPMVHRGPYAGQTAEVDHIVPLAQAPEIGNELANLEMLPETLNRAKSDKVGERQLALATKFYAAGLISAETMARLKAKFVPSGTGKYELLGP
jgi:hypothetical protein